MNKNMVLMIMIMITILSYCWSYIIYLSKLKATMVRMEA